MRWSIAFVLSLILFSAAVAQTSSDTPATKEDVQRYFNVMNFRQNMENLMNSMVHSLKGMAHERCAKENPPDAQKCEDTINRQLNQTVDTMPLDEMIQTMTPILQKHMTKGDVDAFVAFYSSPTGQKMLREQPAMTAELMQAMEPIMKRRMESMQKDMEQELAEITKGQQKKTPAPAGKQE